jgi:hypothetical protein
MLFNEELDKYDKWIIENRYNDWKCRQLKIEYEIKKKIEEFNEFRKEIVHNYI